MQRAKKFLILVLLVCLSTVYVPGIESQAEEMSGEQTSADSGLEDENPQRLEEVTGMDEDGNIFEVDETGGEVSESGIAAYSRSVSVKVVNFRTKGNAVTNYKEYSTGTAGYTNGAYGADAAYLGTADGKVRFMLSGVVGEVDAGDVQVVDFASAQSVSCYKAEDGRLLHYITQDMTTPGHATSLDNGGAPSYLQGGVTYYSYDGHYFYTDYAAMLEDYQNQTRANSVNPGSPYYNYYQYLPFRSRTAYSGADLNSLIDGKTVSSSKLRGTGDYFVNSQNTYGVNALIMAGIAANESGWGTSSICQSKNNLFGLNAVDSSPGTSASTYASVEECIRQFADGWMSRGYLKPSDWRYKGGFLGNKASGVNVSYASDPYWGEKAANIIWRLDQNGGSRDADACTIGIKGTLATDHTSVNVRSGGGTSFAQLYMTGAHSNYAVLIQDSASENSFYRIQSDAVLNGDRSAMDTGTGQYDYEQMYAYISSNYVTIVNQGKTVDPPAPKVLESVYISQPPSRTEYTAGETFDAAGMIVMAKWSDGTESDVTAEVSYSMDALQEGTANITISYTNGDITVTADQAITVNASAPSTPEPEEPSDTTPEPVEPPDTTPEPVEPPDTTPEPVEPPDTTPEPEEPSDTTPSEPTAEAPAANPQQPVVSEPATEPVHESKTGQSKEDSSQPIFQPAAETGGTTGQNGAARLADSTENGGAASTSANAGQNTSNADGQERKAPKTGDESNLMLWSILFVISMSGMISVIQRKRELCKR